MYFEKPPQNLAHNEYENTELNIVIYGSIDTEKQIAAPCRWASRRWRGSRSSRCDGFGGLRLSTYVGRSMNSIERSDGLNLGKHFFSALERTMDYRLSCRQPLGALSD